MNITINDQLKFHVNYDVKCVINDIECRSCHVPNYLKIGLLIKATSNYNCFLISMKAELIYGNDICLCLFRTTKRYLFAD